MTDPEELLSHDGFVRAVARGLLLDESRVDDAVQQTWIAALDAAPESPRSLRAWLATVVRRFALDQRRREAVRALRERGAARPEPMPSMARVLEREAMRRQVVEAVAQLEEPYQSVILLRYFENLPPRELARRLGVPVETARTRVKRALERLRARLEAEGIVDGSGWSTTLFQLAQVPAAPAASGVAGGTLLALAASVKAWIAAAAALAAVVLTAIVLGAGGSKEPESSSAASMPARSAANSRSADAPATAEAPIPHRTPPPAPPAEPPAVSHATPPVAPPVAAAAPAKTKPAPVSEESAVPSPPKSPFPSETEARSIVRGVVRFDGTPPEPRRLDMSADTVCHGLNKDPVFSEEVLVNGDGTLRNVLVSVKKGLESFRFDVPKEPAVLEQKGCVYVPHILALRAGQPLEIRIADETTHNIHSFPRKNAPFNNGQPAGAPALKKSFANAELGIPVKCDIHPWMSAVIHVLPHPHFAITADKGTFELPPLPAGTYVVTALHEKLGERTFDVRLGDRETKELEFVYRP